MAIYLSLAQTTRAIVSSVLQSLGNKEIWHKIIWKFTNSTERRLNRIRSRDLDIWVAPILRLSMTWAPLQFLTQMWRKMWVVEACACKVGSNLQTLRQRSRMDSCLPWWMCLALAAASNATMRRRIQHHHAKTQRSWKCGTKIRMKWWRKWGHLSPQQKWWNPPPTNSKI